MSAHFISLNKNWIFLFSETGKQTAVVQDKGRSMQGLIIHTFFKNRSWPNQFMDKRIFSKQWRWFDGFPKSIISDSLQQVIGMCTLFQIKISTSLVTFSSKFVLKFSSHYFLWKLYKDIKFFVMNCFALLCYGSLYKLLNFLQCIFLLSWLIYCIAVNIKKIF